MGKQKVILLGIDGGSFNIIDPLIDKGLLPNFKKIKEQGAWGTLKSNIHPITPSAWTSIFTGLNPGKHGIFDFRKRVPHTYDMEFINGRSRDGLPIWSLLGNNGHKVAVANIPVTYPPEKVNGIMISGMDTPHKKFGYTHPAAFTGQLNNIMDEYIIDIESASSNEEEYAALISNMLDKRLKCFEAIMNSPEYDFIFLGFTETDRLQHVFWKYIDSSFSESSLPHAAKYRKAIENCYKKIDDFIGSFCMEHGNKLIIVSDHGFGPLHKDVYLNAWLEREGFLAFKNKEENNRINFLENIDWSKTSAYSCGFFGCIYINKKGREPNGIVESEEKERSIKKLLIEKLYELKDEDDGQKVTDAVYEKEALYTGPHTDNAPDVLIKMRDYSYVTRDGYESMNGRIFNSPMALHDNALKHSGIHRLNGILLMRGEGLSRSGKIEDAKLTDIFPLISSMFSIQTGNHDGTDLLL